eukprot:m.308055 g.308055  ORF g.308055 m.308055 type:complete len:1044 (+) comp43326_c0_seq1:101-3232(+)
MCFAFSTALSAALFASIFAFNVDTDQPVIRMGPGGTGKYFGYSVTAYKNAGNWILVGAPRDDSGSQAKFGALYRCEMKRDSVCQPFTGYPDPITDIDVFDEFKRKQRDYVRDQWLGVSVTTSSTSSGPIVTCAHRYVDRTHNFQQWDPVGRCFVFNASFSYQSELAPCKEEAGGIYGFGYCQSGADVKLTKDGSTALISNPGTFNWQGNSHVTDMKDRSRYARSGLHVGATEWSYLAYSVDFGSFHFHGNAHEYVVGIPRTDQYKGKVVVFSYDLEIRVAQVSASIGGEQVTSYFGHTVVAADLNKDGFDDLLVGAPYYTGSLRDQGRVYSYINSQKSSFTASQVLTGSLAKGSFGFSIAVVGNLDRDIGGFVEIAIGAPFADDPTIYIYSTSKNGISEMPTQVIPASSLNVASQLFSGFGSSLSGGVDLDGNDYPDIVVGAFISEKVVVLRSRSVADIIATLQVSPKFLNYPTRNQFLTTLCMRYEGIISESSLTVNIEMEVDKVQTGQVSSRATFNDTGLSKRSSSLNIGQGLQCFNYTFVLQSLIRNLITPLTVDASYSLQEPPVVPSSDGNPYIPSPLPSVLRSNAPFKLSQSAYLLSGCRLSHICIPDLQISSAVISPSGVLKLGDTPSVTLAVSVLNNDEAAFASYVKIIYIQELTLEHISLNNKFISCDQKSEGLVTSVTCEIGNPLPSKQQAALEFVLLLGRLSLTTTSFNITIETGSANPENGTLDDNLRVTDPVRLISVADFGIQGGSSPTQVPFDPAQPIGSGLIPPLSIPQIGRTVNHTFFVQNKGPSPIPQSEVVINWPWKVSDNRNLLYIVGVIVVGPGQCNAEQRGFVNPSNLLSEVPSASPPPATPASGRRRRDDASRREKRAEVADCGAGNAYAVCKPFTCSLGNMAPGDKIDIRILARLYEQTLLQDGIQALNITSVATMALSSADLVAVYNEPDALPKTVSIRMDVVDAEKKEENEERKPWVIPVVVVASALFLTLVIILMVYLGFFKRPTKDRLEEEMEADEQLNSSEKKTPAIEVNGADSDA